MGKGKLVASLTIGLLSINFAAWNFAATSAFAQGTGGGVKSELSKLEQRLFFKTYDDGDDETRLQRIEKRVYGDPFQGPIGDRGGTDGLTWQEDALAVLPEVIKRKLLG
ncbi:MAG: hypothetical protein IAF58_02230 [Leptolyngbya sp.]|nr:hypothetical protein [Candidatus Melainabacteria bacterium]